MTNPTAAPRDDLFTHIHKGLRLALFDVTVTAGRTEWADHGEVAALGARWRPLLGLLRAHTCHEEDHIFRLLDHHDPIATEADSEQHRDLDDLLEHVAEHFEAVLAAPNPADGLSLYRDLTRFVAAYLPHLHDEETRVMGRIWECCSDEEIAAGRSRMMADMTPEIQAVSLQYILPAIDQATRRAMAAGLIGAPQPMIEVVLAIAEDVLQQDDAAELRALVGSNS